MRSGRGRNGRHIDRVRHERKKDTGPDPHRKPSRFRRFRRAEEEPADNPQASEAALKPKEEATGPDYCRRPLFDRPARSAADFLLSLLPMKETSEKTANKPLIFLTNDDGVSRYTDLEILAETEEGDAYLFVKTR